MLIQYTNKVHVAAQYRNDWDNSSRYFLFSTLSGLCEFSKESSSSEP